MRKYEKDEKETTIFEPFGDSDVMNKAYLPTKNLKKRVVYRF